MYIFEAKALFTFVFSFFVTLYLVPIFSKIAFKWGILDSPDGKLKKHKAAIPYLGGVAVWLSFLITCSLVLPFENQFFLYIFASTILLFIGLVDDLIALTPSQKIFGQFLAILCYLKAGFYLKINFFSNVWNIFISAFWFLSIINAFNLIDGIDGLAGGVGLVNFLSLGIIFLYLNNVSYALISFAIAGSILAFLFYNFNPARIFMGDAGSLVLGFMMVALGLFVIKNSNEAFSSLSISNPHILIGGILLVPVIDTIRVMSQRILRKQSPFIADQNHFHHILLKRGFSHKEIVLIIAGSNVLVILVSLMIKDITLNSSVLSLFLVW